VIRTALSGTFSLGLRTKVFPHAIAEREHPKRHHRRKIEGRYPGAYAQRLEKGLAVDPASQVFQGVPNNREGTPQAYSIFSIPR